MRLFWRHGYEGASISALTACMGVTAPSLYAAFGDKKRLFFEAVGRYLTGPLTFEQIIDEAVTAKQAATSLLQMAALGFTREDAPQGCLLASAATVGSPESLDVQEHLAELRRSIEARLRRRIERAVQSGELAPDTDADALAGHVFAVVQGMSTLARDGASRDKLSRVVEMALAQWPARLPRRQRKSRFGTRMPVDSRSGE